MYWISNKDVSQEGYYLMAKSNKLFESEIVLIKCNITKEDNIVDCSDLIVYDKDKWSDNIKEFIDEMFFGPLPKFKKES